jgi:hypothetical protein
VSGPTDHNLAPAKRKTRASRLLRKIAPYTTTASDIRKFGVVSLGDEPFGAPGGTNTGVALFWDIVVWLAVAAGVVGKIWHDVLKVNESLSIVQILTGLFTSAALFLAVRERLPKGTIVHQLAFALIFGYGGGAVGGDIAHAR